jgi:nitrate reductase NapAB chaperone NapD
MTSGTNRAYVLIDTDEDRASEISNKLRGMPGVAMADMVNGPYRVMAVLEGNNLSTIAKTVVVDIRKLDGVKDLVVYTALPALEDVTHGEPGGDRSYG